MNRFPTKILLATDGSEATEQATEAAVDLSTKSGSELHVVHVWHDVPGPYRHGFVKRELRRQGQEILDEQVRKIEESGATVTSAYLRGGRTTDEVIKLGDELEAGLLVVGSRGLRGVRRILIGSHSEDIVHHAHRAVLVVPGRENVWPPARIVAGDDFSEDAKKAAELAAALGKLFGARMLLLHAVSQASGEAVEGKLEDRAGELEDILEERPQTRVAPGDPAEVLIEAEREGEGPTLVAVGTRGLGLEERVGLGGVSTKVIRAGLGAVLVYPHVGER
ncbi:MAG: universal stress protein [Actinomycetota bacterium]|nr:universal stress protein [Actinomycetota bacterium]